MYANKYMNKYLKYKKKYKMIKQSGGNYKTIEEYNTNKLVMTYNEYINDPTQPSRRQSLDETEEYGHGIQTHYYVRNIPYVFGHKQIDMKISSINFQASMTTRGDVLIAQPTSLSCHATSTIMVALTKNIPIPPSIAQACDINSRASVDLSTFQRYAEQLNMTLVSRTFQQGMPLSDKVGIIDEFIKKYGCSCISSNNHLKVIDDVITSSVDNTKKFFIIRDPYCFTQFIYDITPKNNVFNFPPYMYTVNFDNIFTYVK